jgi:K+-sensing histidine kinase KdpD
LFERFYSYDETSQTAGTGIGLNLVKELVDLHGAKITVKSEKDKGSVFELRFKKGKAHFEGLDYVLIQTEVRPLNKWVRSEKC